MNILRYRPSQSAKFMGEKRDSISIGVLYRYASSGFFTELLKGIDQALSQQDCLMMASRLKVEGELIEEIQNYIKQSGAQACILLYPDWSDELERFIKNSSVPIVVIGEPYESEDVFQVNSENYEGVSALVDAMLSKNKRETLVIHGPKENKEAQIRLNATMDVIKKYGLEGDRVHLLDGRFQPDLALEQLSGWLSKNDNNRSFNLVCHTDSMALNAMALLMQKGYAIPEEVSICGHDDIEFAESFDLATVKVNFEKIGEEAAKMSLGLIEI